MTFINRNTLKYGIIAIFFAILVLLGFLNITVEYAFYRMFNLWELTILFFSSAILMFYMPICLIKPKALLFVKNKTRKKVIIISLILFMIAVTSHLLGKDTLSKELYDYETYKYRNKIGRDYYDFQRIAGQNTTNAMAKLKEIAKDSSNDTTYTDL